MSAKEINKKKNYFANVCHIANKIFIWLRNMWEKNPQKMKLLKTFHSLNKSCVILLSKNSERSENVAEQIN
jgi:hypothetical protein